MGRKRKKKWRGAQAQPAPPALPPPLVPNRPISLWPPLLLAALALALYLPTVTYDFVLDDYSIILENGQTRGGIKAISDIFRSSYRAGYSIQSDELYRPLPKAIFALSWEFFGQNPFPLHLLNVLVYALCCLVLWLILDRYTPLRNPKSLPAVAAAALFAAHPVHSEVVANIKSLDELLALVWLLASLWFFLLWHTRRQKMALVAAILAFGFALISKESSITFLAIYPLTAYVILRFDFWRALKQVLWFLLPAAIVVLVRTKIVTAGGLPHPGDNLLTSTDEVLLRLTTAITFLGYYVRLLFLPYPLSIDYSYAHFTLVGWDDRSFWLSLLTLTAIIGLGVLLTLRRHLTGFGILFFFITISVSSNLFIIIGTHFAERLLFLPSVGFVIAIMSPLHELWNKMALPPLRRKFELIRALTSVLVLLVIVVYGVITWDRIGVWKNNLTLFESGVRSAPRSFRTHYYLGQFLIKPEARKYFPEAKQAEVVQRGLSELRTAIAIMPAFTDAWLHIGNFYFLQQNWDSAEYYYRKCISIEPGVATPYNNLGTVMQRKGDLQQAIQLYDQALQRNPTYVDALRNKGSVLGMMGRYSEALPYFHRVTSIAPGDAEGYLFLGITYRNLGRHKEAEHYLNKAVQLNPALSKEVR
ncbi:MAG: tetratricopeptide repeat protein [Chitinophagales bacterium]|nr:tetratricopeptide repeat protein [Chitinophagales bacterium]MDW8428823.1 tetratricopeptide repeat protein [Chitinophagales bacterium]